jgi:quercetin dioxygenase-like cupin family protein
MMTRIALAAVVGVALLVPAVVGAKDAAKKGGGAAVIDPAGDLKWADVPDNPGVKIAAVQGDPNKGAARFFIKLPAGFTAPLHHHTPDHYVVVVAGTMVFNVDGKDNTLPAGSYFSFAECVLYADAHGKWDVVPEKAPAPKK